MRLRWLWVPAFAGPTCDGGIPVTAETIIQSLASGLLMGLLYGLIAVGLVSILVPFFLIASKKLNMAAENISSWGAARK